MNPLETHVGPRNAAVMALALCAALVCLVPASLIGKTVYAIGSVHCASVDREVR